MKITRLWLGVLIGLSLIFCLSGVGYAGFTFESQIPVRTIVVDGDPADWGGVEPFITDDQGDSTCEIGTDIKAVYLAKDDEFLYWRMDTWSGTFLTGEGTTSRRLQIHFSEVRDNGSHRVSLRWENWPDSGDYGAILINYGDLIWTPILVGIEYGTVGQVAEGRIPLSCFDEFQANFVMPSYYSGVESINCDEAIRLFSTPQINLGGFVQHRIYEDGTELNRLYVEFIDQNWNNWTEENISYMELLDPNGNTVLLYDIRFIPFKFSFPNYDGDTGKWLYPLQPDGSVLQYWPGYYVTIQEPLQKGNYHLTVTLLDGTAYETDYPFNGQVDLPVISSSSFKYQFDKDGNLIWTWDVPYYLDPSWETSVRAMINVYKDGNRPAILRPKVSTHLGKLFVPKEVLSQLKQEGDAFSLQIELRTNDQCNRTYSKEVKLKLK